MADSVRLYVVWDWMKSDANVRKHGVSFEEASALFTLDGDYLELFDDAHSDEEDRFLAIGPIAQGVVVVAYTESEEDVIRIISARRASRREVELYRRYLEGEAR